MKQSQVINYCNERLNIADFKDYCANGLQLEGDEREVKKIALGVTITVELIEKAIEIDADLILVHHGLFWDRDPHVIKGPLRKRLKLLFDAGLAVAGYHLPLDFHETLGNNIQLANLLGLKETEGILNTPRYSEGMMGNTKFSDIESFSNHLEQILGRKPLVLPYGPKKLQKVAIVSGGAQGYFPRAIEEGADCFITGEASEQNFSMSKEHGVHFISAGHYHTEQFGIQALGNDITQQLGIPCEFLRFPNPI